MVKLNRSGVIGGVFAAFGEATQRDTTKFVQAAGGKVLGSQLYPFPETTDYSAFLVKAQSSGAKILGICGAGADLINCVKQAHEFHHSI